MRNLLDEREKQVIRELKEARDIEVELVNQKISEIAEWKSKI
jgi:hypothetical protein